MSLAEGLWFRIIAATVVATSLVPAHAAEPSSSESGTQLFTETHQAMATTFSLFVYAHSRQEASDDAAIVFEEVDRIEDLLSNYRETSELSRLNREAFAAPVTTDPEMLRFLQTSFAWSRRSGGAFDMTVGKLMKTWGFFQHQGRVPTSADLFAVRRDVGWQHVLLNPRDRTVRFKSPVELDPGGIGKGYAVERAVDLLRSHHVSAALLSAGSSTIYAMGAPPGKLGWLVRVPAPFDRSTTVSSVLLRDMSLSTANCSEKHFVRDGHLYCHIMDPRTLRPVEDTLQVTVIAPLATDSDALSNALFVVGEEQARRVLRQFPSDAALLLSHEKTGDSCASIRWPGSNPLSSACSTTQVESRNR